MSFYCFFFVNIFEISYASSCLDQGILGFIQDKNSIEYAEQAFPLCINQNQCKPAIQYLEKIKKLDAVKYSFLKGVALANGDCFKKDLQNAEKLLSYCAKYSKICRKNLLYFYFIYAKNNKDYERYVTELALEGDPMAISYLIDKNLSQNNKYNAAVGYFWAKLLYDLLQHKLHNTEKWYNNLPENMKISLSKNKSDDIYNIKSFIRDIQSLITPVLKSLNNDLVKKINTMVIPFEKKILSKTSTSDELSNIGSIYSISGISQANPINITRVSKRKILKKINPPTLNFDYEIKELEKIFAEIKA